MEQDRLDEIDTTPSERNRSDATAARLSGAAVKRPQITDALAQTFFEEWARVGYSALSLDAVARKAGVGKAALYRRWRSKADMARDLVSQIGKLAPAGLESGDRGSLENDLYATLITASRMLRDPLVRRIMPDLYAALGREPALMEAMRPGEAMWEKKVKTLIDRAVTRGELSADIDRRSAMAFLIGPLYWRLVVLGERCTRRQIRQIAAMAAAAIAAG
jgi:AcrR family transcriptional regulator